MTYALTFWSACALIGAFTARSMSVMATDSRLGSILGTLAVAGVVAAVWSWEKRRERWNDEAAQAG